MEILAAVRGDAREMASLELRCFDMDPSDIHTFLIYTWVTTIDYQHVYKAVEDGKIVGGSVSFPTAKGFWYFDSLFVDPEYRRRGIGRKLREHAMSKAWMKPLMNKVDCKQPKLVKYYESFGFKIKERINDYYGNGEDRFVMVRDS